MRKKGKAAPATRAARDPIRSWILSEEVVYLNREKKGAGGSVFGSSGLFCGSSGLSSSVRSVSRSEGSDGSFISNLLKLYKVECQ